jgi:uroporphyrinogen-III synthase
VYRRTVPDIGPETLEALEQQWADSGIDAVTLTSVETLQNLLRLLPEQSRARLQTATLIAASERIARAAREFGLSGPVINARGADDEAMLGALINWHTRARADLACGLD